MKKLIAILVVFAVFAGAAFAQDAGTWSVSGSGQINSRISFIPLFNDKVPPGNHAVVGASNYGDEGSFSNGDVRGNFSLNYAKGIIKAGLSFNQRGAIGASLEANGENWNFRAARDLNNLLTGSQGSEFNSDLWGNYTFQVLEGITLETAVRKEGGIWEAGFDTWTHHDRLSRNYLLVNVKPMAGLEIGFKLPNVFLLGGIGGQGGYGSPIAGDATYTYWDGVSWEAAYRSNGVYFSDAAFTTPLTADEAITVQTTAGTASGGTAPDFLDNSLRRMVFGLKYNVAPIEVAFQFGLNRYGLNYGTFTKSNRLYLGAKYTINDEMNVGVYFRGDFGYKNYTLTKGSSAGDKVNSAELIFGGDFNYSSGPLGAGLGLRFTEPKTAATSDDEKALKSQTFRVTANVRYDIVPENLRAKLAIQFDFPIMGSDLAKDNPNSKAQYTFTPEITYNFLGTGAGDDPATGIRIKYRVQGRFEAPKQTQNELTVAFKWSF